jgi:probable HAF family extracellular repeat protein
MSSVRWSRNSWMLWVTTIVLACFGNAFAQASYKVTDLGAEGDDNLGCAMSVNNEGWTEIMAGKFEPGQQDSVPAKPLIGRALIDVDGLKIDLGTLGGRSSWMMWGEINDFGQVVGYSETAVPDPNGEDVCGLGTHRTCLPFLWQPFHMSALPTLGGNNGQASAINNRGQIVGFAENGTVDSSCPANTTNNRIQLPVLWENGQAQVKAKAKAKALPTGSDPGGNALWINDQGQAVGYTGPCGATNHAVVWENGNVNPLLDYGTGAEAFGNNNRGQIVGFVGSPDGTTLYGTLWQNDTLTKLGLLPGDFGGIASGINDKGQVVGSNFDSNFNWSHAFIWQNNVITDLNRLFPASSNLFAVMANKINERGQISGMAIVRSGPDEGNIHAFLATPVSQSIGRSVAEVAPTRPKSNLPANVSAQHLPRFVLGEFGR